MIYLYSGQCGDGKTCLMVYHAWQDMRLNYPVFSNIGLTFKHEKLTKAFFNNYKSLNLKKCCALFDELSLYIPARRSGSQKNVDFLPFILQTRKKEVRMRITAQQRNLIDLIVRNNIDGEYHVKMMVFRKGMKHFVRKPEDWKHKKGDSYNIIADYYDRNNSSGELLYKKTLIYKKMENVFPIYDTYEVVDFTK